MQDELAVGIEFTDTDESSFSIDLTDHLSGWEALSEPPEYDADEPYRPAALPHPPEEYTYVGVDLGVRNVLAAATAGTDLTDAKRESVSLTADGRVSKRPVNDELPACLVVDGEVLRATFEEYTATMDRLRTEHTPRAWEKEGRTIEAYRDRLIGYVDTAIGQFLDYCDRFDGPLTVVLEDFGYERRSLAGGRHPPSDFGSWLLPTTRYRLAAVLGSRDVRVTYVDPAATTATCHACGETGTAGRAFRCSTDSCPVERVNRDLNAAVNVARRAEPPRAPRATERRHELPAGHGA